jgi:aspartokinase
LVTIYNLKWDIKILEDIFLSCEKFGLNVDMISQTAPQGANINLSFTVDDNSLPLLLKLTAKFKSINKAIRTDINSGNTKITFFGENMNVSSGVAAKVFSVFTQANAEIKIVTTSETEISCLTERSNIIELKRIFNEKGLRCN